VLDQGLAKRTQEDKGIVCKPDGYTRKPNPKLAGIAKETEGKGNREKKDQELEQDENRVVGGHGGR
jgi:hypothetical protein